MGDATPEELDAMMTELGEIQDTLDSHDFYIIDTKIEEVARALGLTDIGLERDVMELSGGQIFYCSTSRPTTWTNPISNG